MSAPRSTSIFDRAPRPPRDRNAHIPARKRRENKRPLGDRVFAKSDEGRKNQLANLRSWAEGLTRRGAIRRRNRAVSGSKKRCLRVPQLVLASSCHACTLDRCSIGVGRPRTEECLSHVVAQGGATWECAYLVGGGRGAGTGWCYFRGTGAQECWLQDTTQTAPGHDLLMALRDAHLEALRAMTLKSCNRTKGILRRALGRYVALLRQVRSELRPVAACRFIVEMGRAKPVVGLTGVDRELYSDVIMGRAPRKGSREARVLEVMGEAVRIWGRQGGDIGEITDRLVAAQWPHPPITPSILPLAERNDPLEPF